ncbi:MAG: glycosyltransferase family 4 protein [Burkholderiales bacterium]
MKLAFCIFKYFPFGGVQRDFMRIAKACVARGHEVRAFVMEWEAPPETSFPVHVLSSSARFNHRRYREFASQVAARLKGNDLVIGFSKMPHLDVYFAADPCYLHKAYTERSALYRMTPRHRLFASFERAVFASEAKVEILSLSEAENARYRRWYQTPNERFHFVPPYVSPDRAAPPSKQEIRRELRRELDIPEEDKVALLIGSGFRVKGVDRALRALASLPANLLSRTHLIVIGRDRVSPFQRLAQRLGVEDRVRFFLGRDDVPRFLFSADLLVHPAYRETAGIVLIEALAAGLPVLTTDTCGYAHHVTEAHGGRVLASPFKQDAFNALLREMLADNEAWGTNGARYAERTFFAGRGQPEVELLEAIGRGRCPPS